MRRYDVCVLCGQVVARGHHAYSPLVDVSLEGPPKPFASAFYIPNGDTAEIPYPSQTRVKSMQIICRTDCRRFGCSVQRPPKATVQAKSLARTVKSMAQQVEEAVVEEAIAWSHLNGLVRHRTCPIPCHDSPRSNGKGWSRYLSDILM